MECVVERQECYPQRWTGTPEDTSRTVSENKPYYIIISEVEGLNTGAQEYGIAHIADNDFILQSSDLQSTLNFCNAVTSDNFVAGELYDEIKQMRAGAVSVRGKKLVFAQAENAKIGGSFKINNYKESIGNSRLYEAEIDYKDISNIKKIDFNFNDTNRAWLSQPALSPSGDVLFLVTNQDMQLKGTDIYFSVLKSGKWSEPINCGDVINTDCDELTPFVSHDGKYLYFSSNGRDNIGGYDIFRISLPDGFFDKLKSNYQGALSSLTEAENLGSPVNTSYDEFFPSSPANPDSILYFSSDRNGAAISSVSLKGGFDIFVRRIVYPDNYEYAKRERKEQYINVSQNREELKIEEPAFDVPKEKLKQQSPRKKIPVVDFTLYKLKGKVRSTKDNSPIVGASVIATDVVKDEIFADTKTDTSGSYELLLEQNKEYKITAHGEEDFYDSYNLKVDSGDTRKEIIKDFRVEKKQIIRINFPYDMWDNPYDMTLDSLGNETGRTWQEELKMLADNILNSIESIDYIVLTGHTDFIASDSYNIKLGKKRVDFVISELVKLGVPENILKSVSKGKKELLPKHKDEEDEQYRKRLRRVTVEKIMKRQKR